MKRKRKLIHLLVSLNLVPSLRLHSYVICQKHEELKITKWISKRMVDEAEKKGIKPWPAIILCTKLGDAASVVQGILDEVYPEARQHFDNVKDFHLTMWSMEVGTPRDKQLMELH